MPEQQANPGDDSAEELLRRALLDGESAGAAVAMRVEGLSAVVAPAGTAPNGKIAVEAAETLRQAIRSGLDAGKDG